MAILFRYLAPLTCGLLVLAGRPASGQQPAGSAPQRPAAQQAAASAAAVPAAVPVDRYLVSLLLSDSQGEVLLSRFAAEKTQNQAVREFANQMATEHAALDQHLRQTLAAIAQQHVAMRPVPQQGRVQPGVPQQRMQQPGLPRQGAPTADARGQRQWLDPARLHYEAERRELDLMQKELNEKTGAEFDEAFMRGQVAAHNAFLARLETFSQYASPLLKPALERAQRDTQRHLDLARGVLGKLNGHQGAGREQ